MDRVEPVIPVTLGGVTLGIAILGWHLIEWWPGRKALLKKPAVHAAALAPFLLAWCFGCLGILTGMGLIGWAFDTALWASNWLGDAALWLGVGEAPQQVAAGAYQPLTTFGNCVVFLATVCMVAAIKFTPAGPSLKRGTWCGLCLGTSASLAGTVAVPLATAVNWLGQAVYGGAA